MSDTIHQAVVEELKFYVYRLVDPRTGETFYVGKGSGQRVLQHRWDALDDPLPLHRLDPLWEELFPAEQARIVRLLVERVDVGPAGADIRLRTAGLSGLVRDLRAIGPDALREAA